MFQPHPDDEYNGPMLVDTNIVYPTNGHANGHDSSSHPVPFVETSVLNSGDFQERTNVHVERYLDEHRRVEEVQSRYDDYSSSRIHHVPGQSVPYENHYPQPTLDVEYGHFEGNGIYGELIYIVHIKNMSSFVTATAKHLADFNVHLLHAA